MSKTHRQGQLRMIAMHAIDVLNQRERNKQVFHAIVDNIQSVGLKKPVTVTPRTGEDGSERYLLICGEGRLKAFRELGQTEIPAMVLQVSDEEAFIMSLTENIARRKYTPLELLSGIEQLSKQGYDGKTIAAKTGLSREYICGILHLLEHGEQRLLAAVETGQIALNAALDIARAGTDDVEVQAVLQQAYESGLRGKPLKMAQKVAQQRNNLGRSLARRGPQQSTSISSARLIRQYQEEVARQKLLIRKADFVQHHLVFVVGALRALLDDEHFSNLLRAEGLHDISSLLAARIWPKGAP